MLFVCCLYVDVVLLLLAHKRVHVANVRVSHFHSFRFVFVFIYWLLPCCLQVIAAVRRCEFERPRVSTEDRLLAFSKFGNKQQVCGSPFPSFLFIFVLVFVFVFFLFFVLLTCGVINEQRKKQFPLSGLIFTSSLPAGDLR